jgi:hypothetical protein
LGAKEAIFKIRNEKGLVLRSYSREKFENQKKKTSASLHFGGLVKSFRFILKK